MPRLDKSVADRWQNHPSETSKLVTAFVLSFPALSPSLPGHGRAGRPYDRLRSHFLGGGDRAGGFGSSTDAVIMRRSKLATCERDREGGVAFLVIPYLRITYQRRLSEGGSLDPADGLPRQIIKMNDTDVQIISVAAEVLSVVKQKTDSESV